MKYELWVGKSNATYSWILARSSYNVNGDQTQIAAVAFCLNVSKRMLTKCTSLSVLTQNYTKIICTRSREDTND